MDDKTFQLKNLEFHIQQTSKNYDKCISKALRNFLESESDFSNCFKPCEQIKNNLNDLMKKYEELNANRLEN